MHWTRICDRTGGIVSSGGTSHKHDLGEQLCGCGATTHIVWYEQLSERPDAKGWCPIPETVRAAQTKLRESIYAAMQEYRTALDGLRDEWDHYDDDGFWQGDGAEPEYGGPILPKYPWKGDDRTIVSLALGE